MIQKLSYTALILFSFLISYSCSAITTGNASQDGTPSLQYDYYVATNGSDSNPGTENLPFRTITHAIQTADTNKTIKVAPGTYDFAGGETFPINPKKDQVLIGDVANRGKGTIETRISGQSSTFWGDYMSMATVYFDKRSGVYGFAIDTTNSANFCYCAIISNGEASIVSNSLEIGYGGIFYVIGSNVQITGNHINNFAYGVRDYNYLANDTVNITGNYFADAGVDVSSGTSNHLIQNNTFVSMDFGILIQNGQPVITGNIFSNQNGFNYGAIWCQNSGSPKIRDNKFYCSSNAILVWPGSNPDMGTTNDPGHNDFSAIAGFALSSTNFGTAKTNYAVGNTWAHIPPTSADIYLCGPADTWIFFGTNGTDFVH